MMSEFDETANTQTHTLTKKLMAYLFNIITPVEGHTNVNVMLNVLLSSIFALARKVVTKEKRQEFILNVVRQLHLNFQEMDKNEEKDHERI